MNAGSITSNIDVAQVVLYTFWIFFALLILYLRGEDKREGYPLVEGARNATSDGVTPLPRPKIFRLADGNSMSAPSGAANQPAFSARPAAVWPGAPLLPSGDPMGGGVGPGSYALRRDIPDVTINGEPRIVPLRVDPSFGLDSRDPDPRGMSVVGADRAVAGTVGDIWVDRSEVVIRYLEVDVGAGSVLLPMGLARIDRRARKVRVDAILASQFANVPGHRNPDQVTLLEEDKIYGYYGGGKLYATPQRAEPIA
ncbi:photosynthetic reaction center subunit H [Methylocella silvestris]|uniref:Photosynthetic reaction center subunit H n=1 Tax=Methylocella silvestris TaxID=199596 RepID=A0A2J7TDD7_METSI|nr:photosynthetic reaction center subunit H [Methylocella silvestris]PNG24778.1 photosynthetic reaction center subunit H [Methylocella silvestris]